MPEGGCPLLDIGDSIPSFLCAEMVKSNLFAPLSGGAVLHNCRLKIFPSSDGGEQIAEIMTCSRPIFNGGGWERCGGGKLVAEVDEELVKEYELETASEAACARWDAQDEERAAANAARARRRARNRIYDLAACNRFDLFVTLTQSPELVENRYDYRTSVRIIGQWLSNAVRRRGLRYVIVPELHKDGAIHWHGLCNADALRLVDSGHKDARGRVIYNLPQWKKGFSTALRLDGEYAAVCAYVSKYITKQAGNGPIGGRYYLHGGELREPRYLYCDMDFSTAPGREFEISDACAAFRIVRGEACQSWLDVITSKAEGVDMSELC